MSEVEARAEWEVARERVQKRWTDAIWVARVGCICSKLHLAQSGIRENISGPEWWTDEREAWLAADRLLSNSEDGKNDSRTLPDASEGEEAIRTLSLRPSFVSNEYREALAARGIEIEGFPAPSTSQPTASEGASAYVMAPTLEIGQTYGAECCNALQGHHPNCPSQPAPPPSSSPLVPAAEAQMVERLDIPAKFCRIKEADNPDYDERFACNECGENFITLCSYARLKAQLRTLSAQLQSVTAERDEARKYRVEDCRQGEIEWKRVVKQRDEAWQESHATREKFNMLEARAEAAESALAALRAEKGTEG